MKTSQTSELLSSLAACANACNYCTTACLHEANVKMMTACIQLDIDCAALCNLVASFIARESIHGKHLLKECAELCGLCAAECEKHTMMQHCVDCAAACRTCEKLCRAAA